MAFPSSVLNESSDGRRRRNVEGFRNQMLNVYFPHLFDLGELQNGTGMYEVKRPDGNRVVKKYKTLDFLS